MRSVVAPNRKGKVKAAEAVCVHGINGIIIGLDDADEGGFGDARHHVVASTSIALELDCNLQSISASVEGSVPKNTASRCDGSFRFTRQFCREVRHLHRSNKRRRGGDNHRPRSHDPLAYDGQGEPVRFFCPQEFFHALPSQGNLWEIEAATPKRAGYP